MQEEHLRSKTLESKSSRVTSQQKSKLEILEICNLLLYQRVFTLRNKSYNDNFLGDENQ